MSAPSQYGGNLRTLEDIQCVCLLPAKCRVLSSDTLTVREYYCSCCSSEEFSTVGCLISSFYFGDRPLQRSNLCKPKAHACTHTHAPGVARAADGANSDHTHVPHFEHSLVLFNSRGRFGHLESFGAGGQRERSEAQQMPHRGISL